jgi:hypothetical protein
LSSIKSACISFSFGICSQILISFLLGCLFDSINSVLINPSSIDYGAICIKFMFCHIIYIISNCILSLLSHRLVIPTLILISF